MLFLQGSRDELASLELLQPILVELPQATLSVIPEADHSFHVPKRTGRTDAQIIEELARELAAWARPLVS
jgi:pimeloyl-ACP methyl ester carboxylesterase